jgi:hypothetical protein
MSCRIHVCTIKLQLIFDAGVKHMIDNVPRLFFATGTSWLASKEIFKPIISPAHCGI